VIKFYRTHGITEKKASIDAIFAAYKGKEKELIPDLCKKYKVAAGTCSYIQMLLARIQDLESGTSQP